MRALILFCAAMFVAGAAYAVTDATPDAVYTPTNLTTLPQAFYCQQPHTTWLAFNASSPYDSELADDIPDEYVGYSISHVTVYHAQWAGGYTPPDDIIINFYNAECPPSMDPDMTYTVPYDQCETEMVYQVDWFVNAITVPIDPCVYISSPMSVGGLVTVGWGQNPPYNGLCLTDEYNVVGCGEAYWAGAFWGMPRWTICSAYWGAPLDLAYCLHEEGGTPTQSSTWGRVKSLYR